MRVLIVEDELHVRTFLCRAVKCLLPGASILAEPDGLQALRSFLANPADLIISDNRMPQMSGLELLCTLRKQSAVPFIMLSAEPGIERHALLSGASAYLGKPVTLDDLRVTISDVLPSAISYTERCVK